MNILETRTLNGVMTATPGVTPTIPATLNHMDGSWIPTDIYLGETFINMSDSIVYTRTLNGIVQMNDPKMEVYNYSGTGEWNDFNEIFINGVDGNRLVLDPLYTYYIKYEFMATGTDKRSISVYNGYGAAYFTDAWTFASQASTPLYAGVVFNIAQTFDGNNFLYTIDKESPDSIIYNIVIRTNITKVIIPT